MTEPLLRWIYPDRIVRRDTAAAEREALGVPDVGVVLVSLEGQVRESPAPDVGAALAAADGSRIVLVRFVPRTAGSSLEIGSGLVAEVAAITEAGDELHAVSRELRARGADTRVICRFSDHPDEELEALAVELGASVVVTDRPVGATVSARVAYVPAGSRRIDRTGDGPVAVVVSDGGADTRGALWLAARTAVGLGAPLEIVVPDHADRRLRRIAEQVVRATREHLVAASVVSLSTARSEFRALIASGSTDDASAVAVRAGEVDRDSDLEETLAQLVKV